MKRLQRRLLILTILALFVSILLLLSLRSMPRYNLSSVEVVVQGGGNRLPNAVRQELSDLIGTSLFSINLSRLEKTFETHALLKTVQIKRSLPSTLHLTLTMATASALVVSTENERWFLVVNDALYELDTQDVPIWHTVVPTIEVPLSYCEMMVRYGLDRMFHQVMALARSLQENTTLISRIKYDNNSSNSFGKMVLELSSLNAHIWVREPVGAAQVHAAVALVETDRQHTLSFLSSVPKRYDLYREGLVRR